MFLDRLKLNCVGRFINICGTAKSSIRALDRRASFDQPTRHNIRKSIHAETPGENNKVSSQMAEVGYLLKETSLRLQQI